MARPVTPMNLAILFQFYTQPRICANRLEILRHFNPHTPIFGLYGGDGADSDRHREILGGMLDDFYVCPMDRTKRWKWRNGDQIIADWYRARGTELSWDTVVLVEWDMVVAENIGTIFAPLKKDEILIPGLRPVREVERWWSQVTKRKPKRRTKYIEFLRHVRKEHGYTDEPLCGYLFGSCLPRTFLEKYAPGASPDHGFMEYKIPIYAQIFRTPFCTDHDIRVWWDRPINAWLPRPRWYVYPPSWMIPAAARALNASKREISFAEIRRQVAAPDGMKLFHPVYGTVPLGALSREHGTPDAR